MNGKLLDVFSALSERYAAAKDRMGKEAGLSSSEFKGLMCLNAGEEISCQELSERMSLSVSRGSRVIDNLFKKGILERSDCTADRRCKRVWLTDKGIQVRRSLALQLQKYEDRLTAHIPTQRLDDLKGELLGLLKNF